MRYFILTVSLFINSFTLTSQTLLDEESLNTGNSLAGLQTSISGFVKGIVFTGNRQEINEPELKSLYSLASLQLSGKYGSFGKAFADFRFRKGFELGNDLNEINLREGYVSLYTGPLEFNIGQKIISWGKADGFNPTNNITPQNTIIRSPDPDDRNMSNFILQGKGRLGTFGHLEALWVPKYRASLLPWDLSPMPAGVTFREGPYPNAGIKNSAWAVKMNINLTRFDASLSWFSGFAPEPGLTMAPPITLPDQSASIIIQTKAYREQVAGFDFSGSLGKTGLRGEMAWRNPEHDYQDKVHVPNPDLWYVFGLDRSMGNFQIIVQYMGRYVFNFKELVFPADTNLVARYQMEQTNRMFHRQQDRWSHSVSARPSIRFLHETLTAEIFGMYNFTTEEYLILPKLSYSLTDGLALSAGLEYYNGKEQTLFNLVEDEFNSVFIQLKATF